MTSNSMSRAEPEVHVVGQLLRASGFDSENAFCVFDVKSGPTWTLLGGETDGQTQTDYAEVRIVSLATFASPTQYEARILIFSCP